MLDEHKQFDFGIWLLFAVGAFAAVFDFTPLLNLYLVYSPVLVFVALGLNACLPPLLGFEPFTAHFMRRQVPRWQLKLPVTARLGVVIAYFWAAVFFVAAGLCAHAPADPIFTALYPNALVVLVGMTSGKWLPPLYLWLFPLGMPTSVEPVIMGMPFIFDRRAARGARAEIQFRVTGAERGDYWLRIAGSRCESFEGDAPAPDVVIRTPDKVWLGIARGELDASQALASGMFSVEGDAGVLNSLGVWFPRR